MRRNRLINITAVMALVIVGASAYLITTEFWGWGVFFFACGALWLDAYVKANWDYLMGLWLGIKKETPAAAQASLPFNDNTEEAK